MIGAVLLVCAVGTLQRWLLFRPPAGTMVESAAHDFIAALLWIPLGACAIVLSRRVPLRRGSGPKHVAIHLAAGVVATALLNLAWAIIVAAAGLWPDPMLGFVPLVARYTVAFLHVDVPVWLLISVVASAWPLRAEAQREGSGADAEAGQPPGRLAVRTTAGTTLVEVERIDWVEAAGDYARLHVNGRSYLIGERMHALEQTLGNGFVRVHRSTIVNVTRVREVRPRAAGDATLVLHDDTEVPLSRRRRATVLGRLTPGVGA